MRVEVLKRSRLLKYAFDCWKSLVFEAKPQLTVIGTSGIRILNHHVHKSKGRIIPAIQQQSLRGKRMEIDSGFGLFYKPDCPPASCGSNRRSRTSSPKVQSLNGKVCPSSAEFDAILGRGCGGLAGCRANGVAAAASGVFTDLQSNLITDYLQDCRLPYINMICDASETIYNFTIRTVNPMPLFINRPRKHADNTKEEGKPTPLRLAKPSKHAQFVQPLENLKEMEKVEQLTSEEIEAPKKSLELQESCSFDSFFNIPEELQDYDEKYDCLDAITMAEIQF